MLSAAVERHVALKRACGFVFERQAVLLSGYAVYAEACDGGVQSSSEADQNRMIDFNLLRRSLSWA